MFFFALSVNVSCLSFVIHSLYFWSWLLETTALEPICTKSNGVCNSSCGICLLNGMLWIKTGISLRPLYPLRITFVLRILCWEEHILLTLFKTLIRSVNNRCFSLLFCVLHDRGEFQSTTHTHTHTHTHVGTRKKRAREKKCEQRDQLLSRG